MSVQASVVVNIVRDLLSDPVYDSSNNPMPANDGGIYKAQTLYRYINDGVKALAEQVGWVVKDWTAFAVQSNQQNYSLNGQWHGLEFGRQNGFQLSLFAEDITLWSRAVVSGQPCFFVPHLQTDHMEVGLFPIPNTTDPTTTLTNTLSATTTTGFAVANAATFLAAGYLQIESEIIYYGQLATPPTGSTTTGVMVLRRGQCGTTAAAHTTTGVTVTHLSAWFKGVRTPNEVSTATSVIELPEGFLWAVQEYVLSKCAYQVEDQQAGQMHMNEFRRECARLYADPNWRTDSQGVQTRAYGFGPPANLAWGNTWIPSILLFSIVNLFL